MSSLRHFLVGGYNDYIPTVAFDPKGTLEVIHRSPSVSRPSWVEILPGSDGRVILAANELDQGRVSTLRLNSDLSLTQVDDASSGGEHTAYAASTANGTIVHAINYAAFSGGNATSREVDPSTGKFHGGLFNLAALKFSGSSVHDRQTAPHPHQLRQHPSAPIVYIPDLGTDVVHVFRETDGQLTLAHDFALPPGTGPRHLQFHPNGEYAYLIGEINNTVTVLRAGQNGELSAVQTISTLPEGAVTHLWGSASVLVSNDGQYLYTSTRNLGEKAVQEGRQDSIRIFHISPDGSRLSIKADVQAGGVGAREFKFTKDGRYLAVALQFSQSLLVFERHADGRLSKVVQDDFDFVPTSIAWIDENTT